MFHLAFRNLFRRRLRSLLTILGIALGTAAYLAIVTSVDGLVDESQAGVDALGTDLSIMQAGATVPWLSHLAPEEVTRIRAMPGTSAVSPVVIGLTRIDARSRFIVFGVDPEAGIMRNATITNGHALGSRSGELLIGAFASRRLGIAPGDRVELMRRVFDVVGTFETGRALLDAGAAVDLATAQELFNLGDRVNIVFVDLDDPRTMDESIAFVTRELPGVEATPSDLFAEGMQRVGLVRMYGRRLALLAFLIAALAVCNTLAMNVSERTREIAILRAMGWRRSRIGAMVVLETVALVAVGMLLSIPLAELALVAVQGTDTVGVIPAHLPLAAIGRGMALAAIAGILLSMIPLAHALRVETAAALRST